MRTRQFLPGYSQARLTALKDNQVSHTIRAHAGEVLQPQNAQKATRIGTPASPPHTPKNGALGTPAPAVHDDRFL